MRTFDFAPFYRSTVGFDRMLERLDETVRSDWPPYNIEKRGEDQYRITMAVAGFGPGEVELTQHGPTLLVTGQKEEAQSGEMLHRGITHRNFKQSFNLADHVKVLGATLEHGLLAIDLVREVPEPLKPRKIEIAGASRPAQETQLKQVSEKQGKAA